MADCSRAARAREQQSRVDEARAIGVIGYVLHACCAGVLETEQGVTRVRYVVASRGRGLLLAGKLARLSEQARDGSAGALSATLHVPDEAQASVQLHVEVAAISEEQAGADADRWQAYHGRPEGPQWLLATVLAGKVRGAVVDGAALALENPLAGAQGPILKLLNADRERLAGAIRAQVGQTFEPVAVGVDPLGIDVRTRAGVVRVTLRELALTPEHAMAQARRLLGLEGAP
jgi:hypothetical protein